MSFKRDSVYKMRIEGEPFREYRDKAYGLGRVVSAVWLCISPSASRHGISWLNLHLEEFSSPKLGGETGAPTGTHQVAYHRSLGNWRFGNDTRETNTAESAELYFLTAALADGELHGKFEEDACHQLLRKYAIEKKEFRDQMRQVLPCLVNYWENSLEL